ncbi:MAG: acyl-CoA thioesterase [Myxococcaceae bacterium]|jgi:acyl-CoA thioester hydrolase|nr:acyl-CoA thioesterase [Myxococcaceae bacterium]
MREATPERWRVEHVVTPAFFDLDPMAIVWHGHYVKYFELARSALLTKLDYDYEQMIESGYVWPVVEVWVKYAKPARLKQPLVVRAEVVEYENRLKIAYRITDQASGTRLTLGSTTQVAVDSKSNELQFVTPRVLWQRLGVAP